MGKKKNKEEKKLVVAEYKVSMHCNACERTVAKAISKIKGMETFMTDMTNHRVVITGRINPQKVLKRLKKTGKRVELMAEKEEGNDGEKEEDLVFDYSAKNVMDPYNHGSEIHMMFNDENANSCSIM